jgi:hypothetical protein
MLYRTLLAMLLALAAYAPLASNSTRDGEHEPTPICWPCPD